MLLTLAPIWSGFVASILWAWFVVPFFHVPLLSIPLAIGLDLVVRLFTYQAPDRKKGEKGEKDISASEWAHVYGWSFIYPAWALLFGYVVHLFIA